MQGIKTLLMLLLIVLGFTLAGNIQAASLATPGWADEEQVQDRLAWDGVNYGGKHYNVVSANCYGQTRYGRRDLYPSPLSTWWQWHRFQCDVFSAAKRFGAPKYEWNTWVAITRSWGEDRFTYKIIRITLT